MACQTPYRGDTSQMLLFKIASCLAEGGAVAGVSSFNGRTGAVILSLADVAAVGDGRYVLKSGDTMTGALTIGNGVLLASAPALNLNQTWNNAAVAFTAFQSNVTETAASASSLLFDFQKGGVSVLNLRTDGRLTLTGRIAATTTSSIGHSVNTSDALNTAVVNVLTVGHTLSAGVGAAGLGARIDMVGDSSTVVSQSQLRIDSSWIDPVQATRTSEVDFILPVSGTAVIHLTLTNNQAQLRDGSAALPSLTFQSDTNTGIYRIGADSFGSSAGGSVILATSTTGINLTTALAYQYNSVNVIRAQTALNNFFFGPSGNLTMTGTENVSIGSNAFLSNTTGSNNYAIGTSALRFNTTGDNNSAVGASALFTNTDGFNNCAIGFQSMFFNTTGNNNSVIGVNALLDITTGSRNTIIGFNTGRGITTGGDNTVIGASVTGLAAALTGNIILATGAGTIRLQIDSSGNTTLAGTVQTAAGTAALPAFSFTADPNTGLYNIGADSVGLSTGGTLRVTTNTTDLILATAFRLAMASGANQRAGNLTLIGGTLTVANTSVTANTIILLTRKTAGGTIGFSVTYTVIAATSFTVTSDNALDTSTYSYLLIEVP